MRKNKTKKIELMHWEQAYSVGVSEIDYQHLELMYQINELISHSIENVNEGKKFFQETMEAVIKQSAIHFETEENLLSKTDYEVFEDHKKEHEDLMAKVENLRQELEKVKEERDLYNLTISFREWFLSHILLYDKEAMDSFKTGAEKS
jgi:hemerythrin